MVHAFASPGRLPAILTLQRHLAVFCRLAVSCAAGLPTRRARTRPHPAGKAARRGGAGDPPHKYAGSLVVLSIAAALAFATSAARGEEPSPPLAPASAPAAAEKAPGETTPAAPSPAGQPAEPAASPATEPAAPPAAEPAAPPAQEPAAPPPEAKPPQPPRPPARKPLTPEELRELPVFTRYDDATWQKLLEKGNVLLEDVKDNTFGYDEEAFYWLAAHVSRLKPDLLKPDEECMPYPSLLAMPRSYRGQPVTIRGVYMSAAKFQVPVLALRKDVPYLYECTIREEPLDEVRPVATVIVVDDPMLYLRAGDEVRVKGYFYKVREYEGTKGAGHAPMLIARRLEPDEGPAPGTALAPQQGTGGTGTVFSDPYLILMIAAVIAMMGAFFYIMQRNKAKAHARSPRQFRVHRFRLRRPDRVEPPGGAGPGGQGGGPKPAGGPDH